MSTALAVPRNSSYRTSPTAAATIRLFDRLGNRVSDYDHAVSAIREGDTVDLGGGVSYRVEGVLGHGNIHRVFAIEGNRILRVPIRDETYIQKFAGMEIGRAEPSEMINATLDGYEALARFSAPVVKVDREASRRGRYIVAERLDIEFRADEYFRQGRQYYHDRGLRRLSISDEERRRIDQEYIEFAEKFWAFQEIGDGDIFNIAYVRGRGWILLDWTHQHVPVVRNSATPLNQLPVWTGLEGSGLSPSREQARMVAEIVRRSNAHRLERVNELPYSCREWGNLDRIVNVIQRWRGGGQ